MNHLDGSAYRGEITYKDKLYTFCAAAPEDAAQLDAMYAQIAIHQDNYKTRLNPESPGSFAQTGGMFVIHNKKSIEAEMAKGESFFAVLRDEGGKIVSSLWVSIDDPALAGFNPTDFPALSDKQRDGLSCALKTGMVVYLREIIVDPAHQCADLAYIICYTVLSAVRKTGFTHALGEVYKVCGYGIGGERSDVGMINNVGYQTVLGLSGKFIGASKKRELQVGDLTVTIEPQIFVLDLDKTLPVLEKFIHNEPAANGKDIL